MSNKNMVLSSLEGKVFKKYLLPFVHNITHIKWYPKSHMIQFRHTFNKKKVIMSIITKEYPVFDPNKSGLKDGEKLNGYDKSIIKEAYVKYHMTAAEITEVTGIPQPLIFRVIKHEKLKPNYGQNKELNKPEMIDLGYFGEDEEEVERLTSMERERFAMTRLKSYQKKKLKAMANKTTEEAFHEVIDPVIQPENLEKEPVVTEVTEVTETE